MYPHRALINEIGRTSISGIAFGRGVLGHPRVMHIIPGSSDTYVRMNPVIVRAGAARGRVELRDVWLRYRPHEPPVLRGIHLRLAAGTKLAVCGRSGCGKTSLLRALVRACSLTFCGCTK